MGKSTVEFISKGLIPLGPKKITRMTTNPEKERYLIYLPLELNDLVEGGLPEWKKDKGLHRGSKLISTIATRLAQLLSRCRMRV